MSYNRSLRDKELLKSLYSKTKTKYRAGAYYDIRKNRLIQYSIHNSDLKKYCSRYTRRVMKGSEHLLNGNLYRKVFDYMWELF